ncbi:uncharacterized protein LOC133338130 [Musca vetustissima]|uniref:uncharacterized protein LOC133338130 n=1 Tax=Musca vetustissima TaxID=27455 RepID=UPI002AB74BE6|nr:uncharacterized protein LOC133338130 [Musca vetustissima]
MLLKLNLNVVLAILAFGGVIAATTATPCTITLPQDIKGYSPVILTKTPTTQATYSLFKPTGKVNRFPENSKLRLICTGSKNVITSLGINTAELTCSAGGQFVDANNNPVQLNSLVCNTIPESALQKTSQKCSNNRGYIHEAGIEIPGDKFYRIFEICYNKTTETTLYTHNTLHGAVIRYNIAESTRRPFLAKHMSSNTRKVNEFYTKKNQLARFEALFGADQIYYDEKKNFLSRGHLTPDADFMFGYEQLSTYYYMNVAPQFQPINGGNWLKVEDMARSLAADYREDIESYNGYFGVVQLPNASGVQVTLYLDNQQQFYIPKYYFKVLTRKSADEAIVFLNVNNPFLSDPLSAEVCPNVCQKANLYQNEFENRSKGYTFCCTLQDFKRVFNGLPNEVQGKRLLLAKKK